MKKQIVSKPVHSDYPVVLPKIKLLPEFAKFTIWASTPRQFREIKTQQEFAKSIGVHPDTLVDWRNRPEFITQVIYHMKDWLQERVPDAIGGLYMKVSGSKATAKDVEMFIKMAGTKIINNRSNKK